MLALLPDTPPSAMNVALVGELKAEPRVRICGQVRGRCDAKGNELVGRRWVRRSQYSIQREGVVCIFDTPPLTCTGPLPLRQFFDARLDQRLAGRTVSVADASKSVARVGAYTILTMGSLILGSAPLSRSLLPPQFHRLNDLILLRNMSSPVSGFEAQAQEFLDYLQQMGVGIEG